MKKQTLLVASFMTVLFFQNCGKVQFKETSPGAALGKPTGETVVKNPELVEEVGESTPSPDVIAPPRDVASEEPETDHDADDSDDGDVVSQPNKSEDKKKCDKDKGVADKSQSYVCVLDGSGQSVKLAYVDNKLVGKNATANDLCMSVNACERIVSQKFKVKQAAFRGFCKNNSAQSIPMSDAQINELIKKL